MVAVGIANDDKVSLGGDTMSGSLTLAGSPPLIVPGATAGQALVSDSSGNMRPGTAAGGSSIAPSGDTTGAADAAGIAAALASGGTALLAAGAFYVNSPLTITTGSRIRGAGKNLTTVTGVGASSIFQFSANAYWWEVAYLKVINAAGHIFAGSHNQSAFSVHDASLQCNSNTSSIWTQSGGAFIEAYFTECDLSCNGSAPSVPAFNLTDTGSAYNSSVFEKCVCTFDSPATAYFFNWQAQGSANNSYGNVFRDVIFEQVPGGAIYALSHSQLLLDNVQVWDGNQITAASTADYIHIGKYSTANSSRGVTVRSYSRSNSTLGSGLYDISFDASTQQILLDSVRASPDNLGVNLNSGCVAAQITGQSPGTVITGGTVMPSQFLGTGNPNSAAVWNARVGDIYTDQAATSGTALWRCTTAGNPGTWGAAASGGGSGTVTSASVVTANGFAGTVASATTTPAVTVSTTVTGLLKGNGTAVAAAASGTDYAPATSGSGLLKGNGSGGFSSAVSNTDYAPVASPTFTGTVVVPTPAAGTSAANKNYVDGVAQGLPNKTSAVAATVGTETFTVASGSVTQINGTTLDGQSPAVNDYVLVKDAPASTGTGSVNSTQPGNGLYQVTSATTNLSLSRAAAMSGTNAPAGTYVFIEGGTANAASGYVVSTPSTSAAFTYGTNNIAFTQFSGAGEITAGTGLSKSGNTLSLTAPVTIGNGGTGQTTAAAAITALTGSQTAGKVLRSDGTNATLATIQAADIPTLNQNTSGTAAGLSATLAVASGGTGQVSAPAAFNALSPNTTLGDVTYGSGTNTSARLAGNTSATKNFLTQTGNGSVSAAPAWGTIAAGDVPTLNQNTTGTAAGLSATLAVASGGTGQTSAASALTALTGAQTAGKVVRSDGTNAALAVLQASDVPTLNQNTSGTAAGLSATLAVASGGTGAATLTGLVTGNGTSAMTAVTAPAGTVVGTTDTQTLTNKRVSPRVATLTVSGSTYTPAGDSTDLALISSPAANFTVAAPSGTPTDGQKLLMRITSGGTGYTPTWNAIYLPTGSTVLPSTALPASKTVTAGFVYDTAKTSWMLAAIDATGY